MSSLFYTLIIYPILFILPAWIANGTPVIFGGGMALDLGKKLSGKPILGKHKTIRGTVTGLTGGFIVAFIESIFLTNFLIVGIALSFGAIFGDLLGSFIKRQLNLKEGTNVLLMDQYLFFLFALIFALPFGMFPNLYGMLVIIVLTGILHRLTNILAHKAKIKQVPW